MQYYDTKFIWALLIIDTYKWKNKKQPSTSSGGREREREGEERREQAGVVRCGVVSCGVAWERLGWHSEFAAAEFMAAEYKIFVGGLSWNTDDSALWEVFCRRTISFLLYVIGTGCVPILCVLVFKSSNMLVCSLLSFLYFHLLLRLSSSSARSRSAVLCVTARRENHVASDLCLLQTQRRVLRPSRKWMRKN